MRRSRNQGPQELTDEAPVDSALGIALTLQAGPAFAYKDVGFDSDDRATVGDPDIRSTARVVWRDDEGVRWLRIRFTAYEPLGNYWFMKAFLDSRGGSRADYVIELVNADQSGKGCSVHPRGQNPDYGSAAASGRSITRHAASCVYHW